MSVRNGLLALLAEQPMHGHQLRREFEARTGSTWPLNIGQVYTTVQRLMRDGLVESEGADGDVERFRLTQAGRDAAAAWWLTPVERSTPTRDELAIKLALAVTSPGVDVQGIVQRQRTETMRALHDYTRLAAQAIDDADLAWSLVLDNLVFGAEAEMRWLDHVEARVVAAARVRSARTAADGPSIDPGVEKGDQPEPAHRASSTTPASGVSS